MCLRYCAGLPLALALVQAGAAKCSDPAAAALAGQGPPLPLLPAALQAPGLAAVGTVQLLVALSLFFCQSAVVLRVYFWVAVALAFAMRHEVNGAAEALGPGPAGGNVWGGSPSGWALLAGQGCVLVYTKMLEEFVSSAEARLAAEELGADRSAPQAVAQQR